MISAHEYYREKYWLAVILHCLVEQGSGKELQLMKQRCELALHHLLTDWQNERKESWRQKLETLVQDYWVHRLEGSVDLEYQQTRNLIREFLLSSGEFPRIIEIYAFLSDREELFLSLYQEKSLQEVFKAGLSALNPDRPGLPYKIRGNLWKLKALFLELEGKSKSTDYYLALKTAGYAYSFIKEKKYIARSRALLEEAEVILDQLEQTPDKFKRDEEKLWLRYKILWSHNLGLRYDWDKSLTPAQILDGFQSLLANPLQLKKELKREIIYFYLNQEDRQTVLSLIEEYFQEYPDDEYGIFRRIKAFTLYEMGQEDEAFNILSKLQSKGKEEQLYVSFYLGRYHKSRGDFIRAEGFFTRAMELVEQELHEKTEQELPRFAERRHDIFYEVMDFYLQKYEASGKESDLEAFLNAAEKMKVKILQEKLFLNAYCREMLYESALKKDNLSLSISTGPILLKDIQSQLGREEKILLYYVVLKDYLALVLIRDDLVRFFRLHLCAREVEDILIEQEKTILIYNNQHQLTLYNLSNRNYKERNGLENDFKQHSDALRQKLLPDEVFSLLKEQQTLLIVPNNHLLRFPFHTLFIREGTFLLEGALQQQGSYLIERYPVSYLPSLRMLSFLEPFKFDEQRKVLLINHGRSDQEDFYIHEAVEDARRMFEGISSRVYTFVLKEYPPQERKGLLLDFLREHQDAALVIFYGHGIFSSPEPGDGNPQGREVLKSAGLLLGDEDIFLSADEILEKLYFPGGPFIILNSCKSGAQINRAKLDEPYGLIRAFFMRGLAR